jgi:hypothetical protein
MSSADLTGVAASDWAATGTPAANSAAGRDANHERRISNPLRDATKNLEEKQTSDVS